MIDGARLFLRDVFVTDIYNGYHAWLHDPAVTKYLEVRFHPPSLMELRHYVMEHHGTPFYAICLKGGGRHIGNIKLDVTGEHLRGDIGILIGERDCWGQGYATEAIQLLSDYAFDVLHLHKLTAGAYAANVGSIKAFERAGFAVEGVRKAHVLCDGEWMDVIELGKVRD